MEKRKLEKERRKELKWPENQIKKMEGRASERARGTGVQAIKKIEEKNSLPGHTINRKSHFPFFLSLEYNLTSKSNFTIK